MNIKSETNERRKQKKIGDQVTEGPYKIKIIYRNGTVKILRGAYEETISIRRLRPYLNENCRLLIPTENIC